MHATSLKNSDPLALISSLHFSKIEQIAPRVLFWELVIISMLGLYLANSLFPLRESPYVQAVTSEITAGPAVEQLVKELKKSNLNPLILGKIARSPFSVGGIMVSLDRDNIQVFEYFNHESALEEVNLIRNQYATQKKLNSWEKEIHLYNRGTLAIFYLGTNKDILSALNKSSGNPL